MSNQTCTCRRLYPSGRAAKNLDPKCPVHGQRTPEGSVAHCPECNGGIAHNVFCSQKSAPKKPNDCTAPECKAERVSFSLFCAEHGRNTDDALRDVCRCGHVRRVHDTQFGCIASTDENEECDCGRFALAPAEGPPRPDPRDVEKTRAIADAERALASASASPDRETLGRTVREVWVAWAMSSRAPLLKHVAPWEKLDEANKEVDRRIGETLTGVKDWRKGTWCRCGEEATHYTIDGADSKMVCTAYPNCAGSERDSDPYEEAQVSASASPDVPPWVDYEIDTDDVCTLDDDSVVIVTGDIAATTGLRMSRATAAELERRLALAGGRRSGSDHTERFRGAVLNMLLAAVHDGNPCPFCLARTSNAWPYCAHFEGCVAALATPDLETRCASPDRGNDEEEPEVSNRSGQPGGPVGEARVPDETRAAERRPRADEHDAEGRRHDVRDGGRLKGKDLSQQEAGGQERAAGHRDRRSETGVTAGDSSSLEERARAFRDFNDGSGTVAMSTNDVERLAALLADVRREAIEDFLRGKK